MADLIQTNWKFAAFIFCSDLAVQCSMIKLIKIELKWQRRRRVQISALNMFTTVEIFRRLQVNNNPMDLWYTLEVKVDSIFESMR